MIDPPGMTLRIDLDREGHVPEFVPPIGRAPEPAEHIPFLKAFLFNWISPTMGLHLAAGSLSRALAGYLLSIAIVIPQTIIILLLAGVDRPSPGESLRARFVMLVIRGMSDSSRMIISETSLILLVISAPVLIGVALALIGIIMAPLLAAGDRATSVFRRSVNNAFWAFTVFPWISAVGILIAANRWHAASHIRQSGVNLWLDLLLNGAAISLLIIFLGTLIFPRFGQLASRRYIGPAVGPGFDPRRPRCEDCGYFIGGLRFDSKCPECGLDVTQSMPTGRRCNPEARASLQPPVHIIAYVRFWRRLLSAPDGLRRLPLTDVNLARRAWWNAFAISVIPPVLLLMGGLLNDVFAGDRLPLSIAWMGICCAIATPVLQIVFALIVCIVGRVAFGVVDMRASFAISTYVGLYYLLIPIVVSLYTLCAFIPAFRGGGGADSAIEKNLIDEQRLLAACVAVLVTAFSLRRMIAGLRVAAFANS